MKILLVSADRTGTSGSAINLGDAFLSDRLANALEASGHAVQVADFGGLRVGGPRPRLRLPGLLPFARAVRTCEVVVIGGGTLLQDDSAKPWGGLPRLMAVTSVLCWLSSTRCVFFGVGCDPVSRCIPRLLLRTAVRGRTVWVRDTASMEHFTAIADRQARLAADVCLLGGKVAPRTDGQGVILALAAKDAAGLSPGSVQALRESFGSVTFLQMSQGDGRLRDGDYLPAETREELDSITADLDWAVALEAYASSELVIASRMHALYMGMLTGRSLLAVGTSTKVRSFVDEFGIDSFPSADQAALAVVARQGGGPADRHALATAVSRVRAASVDLFA